jgi:hypothetical protein
MKYIGKYLCGEILLLKYTSCKSAYRKVNFVTLYKLIPVLNMRTKTFRDQIIPYNSFWFFLFPEIQMYGIAMYIIYPNTPIVLQGNWFE